MEFNDLVEEIEAKGGYIAAVSSEKVEQAAAAKEEWKLSFDVLSNVENTFPAYLNEKKYFKPKLAVTTSRLDPHTLLYSHGFVQPGVLFLSKEGEVLFQWAIQPGIMNLGGATDRPEPGEIWKRVQARLDGDLDAAKAKIDTSSGVFSFRKKAKKNKK
mmetsp:Transcript_3338/g.11728  ORF Transcript_3338/g.11728 Transcript_3338/m.11728 type:complete len:158 (-) Transcript_3338:431-904(-)